MREQVSWLFCAFLSPSSRVPGTCKSSRYFPLGALFCSTEHKSEGAHIRSSLLHIPKGSDTFFPFHAVCNCSSRCRRGALLLKWIGFYLGTVMSLAHLDNLCCKLTTPILGPCFSIGSLAFFLLICKSSFCINLYLSWELQILLPISHLSSLFFTLLSCKNLKSSVVHVYSFLPLQFLGFLSCLESSLRPLGDTYVLLNISYFLLPRIIFTVMLKENM